MLLRPHIVVPMLVRASPFITSCLRYDSSVKNGIKLVSVLHHPEYNELRQKLEVKTGSVLDSACLHILRK